MQEEVNHLLLQNWKLHYNTKDYEGSWEALPLRSINGDTKNILALDGSNHFEDTFLMGMAPYIKQVADSLLCPKMSIRLLNLKAGAIVHAHSDQDLYFEEGEVRLHVPIVTNSKAEFYLEEERIVMEEGECWYMNLALKHRLHNKSTEDRIHLVIDCKVNDWMAEQFRNPAIIIKKEISNTLKNEQDENTKRQVIAHLRLQNTATSNSMANEMEAALK
jgi:mannose-6-phosphate isomerase-like protein (cupin superfamily)